MQEFKRIFRVWDFLVSHDQLLLRSPKNAGAPKNLDFAFVGVEYFELPTKMHDLCLDEPTNEDHRRVEQVWGKVTPPNKLFVVETRQHRYVIVAAALKILENELDVFESSLENF